VSSFLVTHQHSKVWAWLYNAIRLLHAHITSQYRSETCGRPQREYLDTAVTSYYYLPPVGPSDTAGIQLNHTAR